MKEILLSQQGKNKGLYVALVDDEDFERVNQFRWHVHIIDNCIYAERSYKINGKPFIESLHNFILGCKLVDHADNNGSNCQKYNLRRCTTGQNMMNKRPYKNSTSTYKGVHRSKRSNKWTAAIIIDRKSIYLGLHVKEIDAAKAYDAKAKELFKEFAWLNFPEC